MAQCQFCGAEVPFKGRPPRTEECPACRRDVHCCRQCVHFDPALNNSCRETSAEWIVEKDRRNFCDYFLFSQRPAKRTGPAETADEKWKRLFGKKE